jgi:hypothetical protein
MNIFIDCGSCASPVTLPALPADPCCITPPGYSQISTLIITPCGAEDPFVLETGDVVLVPGEIDNTNADGTKSKMLIGQGGIGDHEPTIYDGPFRKQIVSNRTYSMEFEVSLGDAAAYDFLLRLQCNFQNFRFWYQDLAGWLYGTVNAALATDFGGITPSFVNVQMPKGAGRDDLGTANVLSNWEAETDPVRYLSPLAIDCGCVPVEEEEELGG